MPERLTEKIELRCTPREKAEIDERALAAGMKRSEFLRARALGQRLPSNPGAKQEQGPRGALNVDNLIALDNNVGGVITEADFKRAVNEAAQGAGFTIPFPSIEAS